MGRALPVLLLVFLLPASAGGGDKPSLRALFKDLSDWQPAVRRRAAEALSARGDKKAVIPLGKALVKERDGAIARVMVRALVRLADRRGLPGLLERLGGEEDPALRDALTLAMKALGPKLAWKMLTRRVGSEKNGTRRSRYVTSLGGFPADDPVSLLCRLAVLDRDVLVRARAREELARIEDQEGVKQLLRKHLLKGSPDHRARAARAVSDLELSGLGPILIKGLGSGHPERVRECVRALGTLRVGGAAVPLASLWSVKGGPHRGALAWSLGRIGASRSAPLLFEGLRDADWLVRFSSAHALTAMSDAKVRERVAEAVKKEGRLAQAATLFVAGETGDARIFPLLAKRFPGLSGADRSACLAALAALPHGDRVAFLRTQMGSGRWQDRAASARAAGRHGLRPLGARLESLTEDPILDVRMEAVKSLGMLGEMSALGLLKDLAENEDTPATLRALSLQTLGKIIDHRAGPEHGKEVSRVVSVLVRYLSGHPLLVSAAAVWALEKCRVPGAVDALIHVLETGENGYLVRTAAGSLGVLTGAKVAPLAEAWKSWWKANRAGFSRKALEKKEVSLPAFRAYLDDLRQRGLDLCLVLDVTGSMDKELDFARKELGRLLALLARLVPSLRLGFVAYDDEVQVSRPLSYDHGAVLKTLAPLTAFGGGDWEEGVCPALRAAVTQQDWRRGARKVIVLVGDAAPHDPERAALITRLAREGPGIEICCVAAHTVDLHNLSSFVEMGLGAGGGIVPLRDQRRLFQTFVIYALGPAWRDQLDLFLEDE